MPCQSGKYQPQLGAIIQISVTPAGQASKITKQQGQLTLYAALVDTGATTTCISSRVAQSENLLPTGKQPMVSATQTAPVNQYIVDLVLPFGSQGFINRNATVLEFTPHAKSPFQMLLGRDILCNGYFALGFDGTFTFCL